MAGPKLCLDPTHINHPTKGVEGDVPRCETCGGERLSFQPDDEADSLDALLDAAPWTFGDEYYRRMREAPVSEVLKDADLKIEYKRAFLPANPQPPKPTTPVTDRLGTLRHNDGTVVRCDGYPKHNIFGPHKDDGKRWWQVVVHNPRHPLIFSNDEISQWPVIFEGDDD